LVAFRRQSHSSKIQSRKSGQTVRDCEKRFGDLLRDIW
jgi:hypothetical protein